MLILINFNGFKGGKVLMILFKNDLFVKKCCFKDFLVIIIRNVFKILYIIF